MKKTTQLPRDFHKLAMIRREARGNTTTIASKKYYQRKKEKASWKKEIHA
jgi:hypothetical protein